MKLIKLLLISFLGFSLSASVTVTDTEDNDDCTQAQLIMNTTYFNEHNVTMTGGQTVAADVDYFAFKVTQDGSLSFLIENTTSSKLEYAFISSSCGVPASTTTINGNGSTTFTPAVTKGNTYYLYLINQTTDGSKDVTYNLTVGFAPASVLTFTANERAMTLAKSYNIFGDSETIGNGVLWKPTAGAPTDRNNAYDMDYIDIDGNASTYNSSSALLDLNNSGYTVVWAGLYWQGHICEGGTINTICRNDSMPGATETAKFDNAILQSNQIYFKVPNGDYTKLLGDQDKFNYILQDSNNRMLYTASADVTSLVSAAGEGNYTVANLSASEGQIDKWGGIGGWALVVIYQDPSTNLTLKNISVFDGYQVIESSDTVDVPITGFFTPSSGTVNSAITIFTIDGDKLGSFSTGEVFQMEDANSGDALTDITNALNPLDNQFNSSISKFGIDSLVRNPNNSDNLGVDIDTFDVSAYLTNGQSTTSFRFSNDGDLYNLNLIVFSTELYQPQVCYTENLYVDGVPYDGTSTVQLGSVITSEVNVTNRGVTDALGVSVQNHVQDEFSYDANTIRIDDISSPSDFILQTDTYGDDEADYNSSSKTMTLFLGTGASGAGTGTGGTIAQFEIARFDYNATLALGNDANSTQSTYYVSYTDNDLGITFNGVQMPECTPGGGGITIGIMDVTIDGISIDDSHTNLGVIQTKIADKPFTLEASNVSGGSLTTWTAGFDLPIVVFKLDDNCSQGQTLDPNDYFTTIYIPNGSQYGTSSSVDINESSRVSYFAYSYFNYDNLFDGSSGITCVQTSTTAGNIHGIPQCLNDENKFETFFDGNATALACLNDPATGQPCKSVNHGVGLPPYNHEFGCLACVLDNNAKQCSDSFSVRPDGFNLDLTTLSPADPSNKLRSGQDYNIDTTAYPFGSFAPTSGYNQGEANLSITAITKLSDGTVDANLSGTASFPNPFEFVEGSATTTPVNFTFNDVGLITIDLNDTLWAATDSDDTPFADRVINGSRSVTFIPWDFNITGATLTDANDGSSFTYFSDDMNMSAKIPLTLRAQRKPGSSGPSDLVTVNYGDRTALLYEKDITMTMQLVSGFGGLTPITQGITNQDLDFNNGEVVLTATDPNLLLFNFDRQTNNPLNPIVITGADANLTAVDTDNVTGNSDGNASGNATFYYGRLHAPRTRIADSSGIATFYYEIYCYGTDSLGVDCNTTLRDNITGGTLSVDDVRWFINSQHTNTDGNTSSTSQKYSVTNNLTQGVITNGVTTVVPYSYTGDKGYPYKTTMHVDNSSWLMWNKFAPDPVLVNSYELEFNRAGDQWAGKDLSQEGVDANASTNTNRRIQW